MQLVMMKDGMIALLNAALRGIPFHAFYGLFQNDWTPTPDSVIGQVQPCDFSGYAGLISVGLWLAPTIVGQVAVTESTPRTWTRGVGPNSNWVSGYYVVDSSGVLLWGERDPGPPAAMIVPGDIYQVTPAFSQSSRF